tara:strand:+ start:6165 stop:6392 length:228 start_codon:yes stop_codon:yes gene_type:complete
LTGMIVAFCIIITEGPRHIGGESICHFYNPKIEFKTEKECIGDKKMVIDWFKDEAKRLYPKAIRVDATAVCHESK